MNKSQQIRWSRSGAFHHRMVAILTEWRPGFPVLVALILMSAALAGCTVGPDFIAPSQPRETNYVMGQATTVSAEASGDTTQQINLGGVGVSYDLDVFGRTHRSIELAAADKDVQQEAFRAARLSVVSDTVLEALQIASTRVQIDVADSVIASDKRTLGLVQSRQAAGAASDQDVTTAQSQVDRDRTLLPALRQQLDMAQDALATLVGSAPADWSAPQFRLSGMSLPQDVPLVVPSELVRSRPDIRAAEAQLHAASAAVGIATADLYPRISLSANVAEQGLFAGPAGAAWSLVGGITAPIFHGGALSANQRAAQDAYKAALAQYQQTVLTAFRQIADTLHALQNSADAVKAQRQALNSATKALGLSREAYIAGNSTILQVLDAQRLQQLAELSLVQVRTERFLQTVNLFVAAGAGLQAGRKAE
jgi:NodT family efflux transporter outer membrane factor (OMF) lipoprotein